MKCLISVTVVAITLAITTAAHANEQRQSCEYTDLYSGNCEQDLVRFLQKLDLTAVQKSTIDQIYSQQEDQRKVEIASYVAVRDDVLSLDPADPEYAARVAQLAAKKADHVEQCTLRSAATQAQVYQLLTQAQKVVYGQLRSDWVQGRFASQELRVAKERSRPTARNWASSSITF